MGTGTPLGQRMEFFPTLPSHKHTYTHTLQPIDPADETGALAATAGSCCRFFSLLLPFAVQAKMQHRQPRVREGKTKKKIREPLSHDAHMHYSTPTAYTRLQSVRNVNRNEGTAQHVASPLGRSDALLLLCVSVMGRSFCTPFAHLMCLVDGFCLPVCFTRMQYTKYSSRNACKITCRTYIVQRSLRLVAFA